MNIGDRLLIINLHRMEAIPCPAGLGGNHYVPFVRAVRTVTVTAQRQVSCHWGGSQKYTGYRAIDARGCEYLQNWNTYDGTSMSGEPWFENVDSAEHSRFWERVSPYKNYYFEVNGEYITAQGSIILEFFNRK